MYHALGMSTAREYVQRARALDEAGLRALWRAIIARHTPDWPEGWALEHLVLRAFELEGAAVRWPYEVQVYDEVAEQIDGVIHHAGLSVLVETKDQQAPINVDPLAKLRSQLLRRPGGTVGLVFSRSGFTTAAQMLAGYMAPTTILLWSGAEIGLALDSRQERPFCQGLQWKFRLAVEEGAAFSDLTRLFKKARSS